MEKQIQNMKTTMKHFKSLENMKNVKPFNKCKVRTTNDNFKTKLETNPKLES